MLVENATFEKHYRIGDLARLWSLGRETVRKLVKDDPGVVKIRMGRKKAHTIYSVPESAAQRITHSSVEHFISSTPSTQKVGIKRYDSHKIDGEVQVSKGGLRPFKMQVKLRTNTRISTKA